jgi:hypothetical protein
MSNLLSIQPGLPLRGSGEASAPTRSIAPTPTPPAKPVPLFVNPSFQFDSTVGLVVIDFRDTNGTVTNSIPSQQQLDAYRSHLATPPGDQPPQPARSPSLADGKTTAG